MIELYFGDCLELMKQIPDKSVDLIFADLPYELTNNKKDKRIPFEPLWEQYKRIRKPTTPILLYGQGLFYVDLVNSNRKEFKYDIVWDKVLVTGFLNAKKQPLRQHEQVAVFYKKQPIYNPQFTKGKPLHSMGQSYKTKEQTNNNYGDFKHTSDERKGSTDKYPTSILRHQKPHPSIAQHRTEKSLEFTELMIKTYTNEGMTVLDNTMGSGVTGLGCINTNRKFIGIEKDVVEFNKTEKRINNYLKNK